MKSVPPSKKPTGKPKVAPAKVAPANGTRAKPVPDELTDDDIPSHPAHAEEDDELVDDTPLDDDTPIVDDASPPNTPEPEGEKIDKTKVLGFIESIIGTLTFRTVSLVALLTAIGLIMFALYENRDGIVGKITKPTVTTEVVLPPTTWVLSESSKQSLISLAKATDVGMIILSDVDLKKNRRTVRYYYLDDDTVKLEPAALQALALPLPVFDYDARNTAQMVATLSNDFRCDPYKETVYNRYAPELAEKFPLICRLAVPPFVGMFVGFITVGIAPGVDKSELDSIRLEVSRIAVEIYMNDVTKKITPSKTPGAA